MEDLLDNAPCGFLAFADDGIIRVINATLLDLLGYQHSELQGRHFEAILPPGGRIFYQTHFFPLLKMQGRVDEMYLALRSRSGGEVPVLLNAARQNRAGAVVNACVFLPMRQRSLYEAQILHAKKAAEEARQAADRARSELEQVLTALQARQAELLETNARLEREMRELDRLREREHRIAEVLQDALYPSLPGTVPGLDLAACYRPALDEASVGGDFFDVFTLEKGGLAIVVADLSGKGLTAAAQVGTVRHMLRALLYLGDLPLSETLDRLNGLLTEHDLLAGFATLFVGVYDVNSRTLTYASCGQEPGLLYRAPDGTVEELGPTGPVLGGFGGAVFGERCVTLARGDVLALFTDGLTEAGPNRKDLLEIPGMVTLLKGTAPAASSADAVVTQIMAGVEAFATTAGMRDDVCLLVARAHDG